MDVIDKKRTLSKISFICALTLILAIALLYLYNITKWGDYPDFGFYRRTGAGVGIFGIVTEPGRKAGIQVGDLILSVNGKAFKNIKESRSALNLRLGEQNAYLMERRGHKFEITIINTPLGVKGLSPGAGFPT